MIGVETESPFVKKSWKEKSPGRAFSQVMSVKLCQSRHASQAMLVKPCQRNRFFLLLYFVFSGLPSSSSSLERNKASFLS